MTVEGVRDLLIVRKAFASAFTVSEAVIGAASPGPVIVAMLVMNASVSRGAKSLTSVSYTMVVFPPAGTVIHVMVRGEVAVSTGAACNTPFVKYLTDPST